MIAFKGTILRYHEYKKSYGFFAFNVFFLFRQKQLKGWVHSRTHWMNEAPVNKSIWFWQGTSAGIYDFLLQQCCCYLPFVEI